MAIGETVYVNSVREQLLAGRTRLTEVLNDSESDQMLRLLEEVDSHEQAWLIDTGRQERIRVQRDTNTIFISSAVHRPDLHINENQESRLTAVSKLFPRALAFMTEFAQELNCHLSRASAIRCAAPLTSRWPWAP